MENNNPNPWGKANIISKITFWWIIPFILKGYRKGIQEKDLYDCIKEDTSEHLGNILESKWKQELKKYKEGQEASLSRAIIAVYGRAYLWTSILPFIEECILKVIQSLALGMLVKSYNNSSYDSPTRDPKIYWSAIVVCLTSILCQFTRHPYFINVRHIGMRARMACCTLVLRKALKLSTATMGETTVGQMVNLVSNDVGRFDQSVLYLPFLIIGPIQMAITIGVLWNDLGYSCLAAMSLLILYIPIQGWLGRIFSKLRSNTAVLTDERISLMSEVVAGMRIIKMYTWEKAFGVLVAKSRKKEIAKIRQTSLFQFLNVAFSLVFSKINLLICFMLFTTLGGELTAALLFVTMTLFNHLRVCMTFCFANGVCQLAETRASIKRLQTFLLLEEQQEMDSVQRSIRRPSPQECGVRIQNISARWDYINGSMTLDRITAEIKPGELLAVIGSVGSGKTSLLMAILGELQATRGKVAVNGKVSYASQEPWTFTGTIRQNILFGNTYDLNKYKTILHICALDKDISDFPRGDLTMTGERGVSLSGGQRARVNLARALYLDADIYLLDDPLSAVDSAVAKHLFENINKYLKCKVRVLVTHQIHFLRAASKILVLNKGKIEAYGTYSTLANSGMDFVTMSEDIAQDQERRMSIMASPIAALRRTSIAPGRLINKRGSQVTSTLQERRKSVLLTGRRKSELMDQEDRKSVSFTAIGPDKLRGRKKSFVATIFSDRNKSFNRRDSVRSTTSSIFDEEMTGNPRAEISPFGPFFEQQVPEIDEAEDQGKLEEESKSTGAVSRSVFLKYLRSGAGVIYLLVICLVTILMQVGSNGSDYWITLWTNVIQCNLTNPYSEDDKRCTNAVITVSQFFLNYNLWYSTIFRDTYMLLVATDLLLSISKSVLFCLLAMRASTVLHNNMFSSVIKSKIAFFDCNPVGRILNRFTKDIGIIDDLLPITFFGVMNVTVSLLGSITLVVIINPWIALPTLILGVIFAFVRTIFVRTMRDVKRIEGIVRSPVYSTLATALYGLTTIRAFGAQSKLEKEFYHAQDHHSSAWFAFIYTAQYFGMVLDFICALYVSAITVVLLLFPDGISGGNIGLAISTALVLGGSFQWGVRLSVELETHMTSVERLLEYSSLPPEAATESEPGKKPPSDWPQNGQITFSDMYLQYSPNDNPILRDFNCTIKSAEKVGIVGRTGAGKSSLITALFRMAEPDGTITIDGKVTKNLGLHDLRSKISIIPQEPLIFCGTVKKNLDPFDEFPDPDLWSALEEVELKPFVQNLSNGLMTELSENGGNLSVGQRQLFCLARVILRRNRILVMDEATANIDHKTDYLIQKVVKENFSDCTILTVAHRLNTIIDYDKIMVLDKGSVAEFDAPYILLQNPEGIFTSMVEQTGKEQSQNLRESARRAFIRMTSCYENRLAICDETSHETDSQTESQVSTNEGKRKEFVYTNIAYLAEEEENEDAGAEVQRATRL